MKCYQSVLVIPDRHIPFAHKDALAFVHAVIMATRPEIIVDLGDEVDNHNLSFHQSDNDLPFSASGELDVAIQQLKEWYKITGDTPVRVCNSNHGSLLYRKAKHEGIPRHMLRDWSDILEAPKTYSWHDKVILNTGGTKTLFMHSIKANSLGASKHKGMNICQGHYHSRADIQYWKNDAGDTFFGTTVGCLVDEHSLGMHYGKLFLDRPMLGVLAIMRGVPYYIPMVLDNKGRWIGKLL